MIGRVAAILLFAVIATTAWLDMATFYDLRAWQNYLAGNHADARNNWQSALRLQHNNSARKFNRGVALYRLGELRSAADDFTAAATGSDPSMRHMALYNQGNCLARLAEQCSSGDQAAAAHLYEMAADCYGKALLLRPGDQETLANQAAVLAARKGMFTDRGGQPAQQNPSAATQPNNSAAGEKNGAKTPAATPGSSGNQSDQPATDEQGTRKARRKTMGREQAERLLNEKRGQEAIPSAVTARKGPNLSAPPAKDW